MFLLLFVVEILIVFFDLFHSKIFRDIYHCQLVISYIYFIVFHGLLFSFFSLFVFLSFFFFFFFLRFHGLGLQLVNEALEHQVVSLATLAERLRMDVHFLERPLKMWGKDSTSIANSVEIWRSIVNIVLKLKITE